MKHRKGEIFNFGKSWGIIIFCFFSFWFYGGMAVDSCCNIVIPALSERLGMQLGTLLTFYGFAAIIGAVFLLVMGFVNKKIGPRYTSFICMILACVGYFGLGHAQNFAMFAIFLIILLIGGPAMPYIAGGALTAQWFPKKSGVVMGYTTAGLNFSSMLFIPMSAFLVGHFGVSNGVLLPIALCLILAVVGIIFVRDNPRQRGLYPDNVSAEIYKNEYYDNAEKEQHWKMGKMLKKGVFWQVAFGSSLFQFVTALVITQLLNRGVELGFEVGTAVLLISVCSVIGFVGSWLVGVIDTKTGTKKAMYILAVWYIIALVFNWSGVTALVYVFYAMYGIALGGSANFMNSLVINVFGRHLFTKLNIVLCPIQIIVQSMGILANGIVLNITGTLRTSYIIAIIVVIINMILIATIKEHKYDPDFMTKAEGDKFMDSLGATWVEKATN